MLTLAVVCEADADRRIACDLADRVFVEQIGWLSPEDLPHQRHWRGRTIQEPFLSWAQASELARQMKFRAHGHFHGVPGAPDAVATRKALVVLRMSDPLPDGIVLTRDDDGDVSRLKGIRQAVGEFTAKNATRVAVGVAHVMRENWVIAGFWQRGTPRKLDWSNLSSRRSSSAIRRCDRKSSQRTWKRPSAARNAFCES